MTTQGIYAADGSQRVTVANVDGGTIGLTVDTTGLATQTTLAALNTAIGTKSDTAWNGSDASASLISIMKAIWAK